MNKKISKDWQDWIKVNIERGCDLEEIRDILLKEGFNTEDIKLYISCLLYTSDAADE